MQNISDIKISSFDYELPEDKIAKYPLQNRDSSKLLVYHQEKIKDYAFKDISDILPSDSRLIFNNTKVIRARLRFKKETGANIEIFCLEPYQPADYEQSFGSRQACEWTCMIGNSKKWKEGILSQNIKIDDAVFKLYAERIDKHQANIIRFSWDNQNYSFSEILEHLGELPIPPYLNRKTEESDLERYQTVYSKIKGSVAAPTAGLHFTPEVLQKIRAKGVQLEEVTLHVGAGTFKPVKSEQIGEHQMHTEHFIVRKETLTHLLEQRPNIPVGTTSVRTLESLFWLAEKIKKDPDLNRLHLAQWEPYQIDSTLDRQAALEVLIAYLNSRGQEEVEASTDIMIVPSYDFKFTDAIITNFHQPKSTLLLLISALTGEDWKRIYQHALENHYRFLSYGDSSLLNRTLSINL